MKAILKIFLIFACAVSLFAGPAENSHDFQAKILKELDIDLKFMNTSYYKDMKNSIKTNQINAFSKILKDGYRYVPVLKAHINESGIPGSFLYLAMIESGFSNHIVSSAKAVGMWQFMEKTARLHGLKINKYVDERRDPIASTKAATTYLKGLKSQFGKWYLAIMAYNCGEGRLQKGITMAGTDDIAVLLDPSKNYLPKETRNFIIKILRASFIAKDSEFLLSKDAKMLQSMNGLKLTKVSVPGGTNLIQVADSIGVGVTRLKEDNSHLKFIFTPPTSKNYYVYIPESKKELFEQNFKPFAGKNNFYTYTVKKGDTLLGIAKKEGISHRAIKEYNELKTNLVAVNQKLIIPDSAKNKIQNYVVKTGDTLATLSKKFNVDAKDIAEANSIARSDVLKVGVNIVIP
ncbi:lytic transglycosylase domain-containing protein [Campylobacter mucosalis]|uniref:Membrane-bound lytic murein transglycosylase D n=1 Tax=Campylobacter mucosalis CCUG 21559 TaxID=1032067 RepID=A0A6G5QGT7_9BACT|nr:lytic transglycosylase domain-containing protein [Campylobacter mucosalis]KEA46239.1 lytic transglycosylase [Campylobacter mucosalis]QCD44787.1 membrane-bound lytic murein transglycosylase D [Campylobacter mucosalis CCUG 21559]QKF62698.1 membrane-bound lytic murein transglycosylase D [Campylobacter mucosalis]